MAVAVRLGDIAREKFLEMWSCVRGEMNSRA
jgi:hypothetical protein